MTAAKIRDFIGNLWGRETTVILSLSAALLAACADPQTGPLIMSAFPFMPKVLGSVALGAALLRVVAPPKTT